MSLPDANTIEISLKIERTANFTIKTFQILNLSLPSFILRVIETLINGST